MDTFKIDLLSHGLEGKTFEYDIDDAFWGHIDGLIQRGKLHTTVTCISANAIYKFRVQSVGTVIVPCDRCMSDLELRIETTDVLNVKLGDEYVDEGDCVVVPEAEGRIDLAQFIYEFIVLSMPIVCCHEPGKCDDAMMHELSRHQSTRSGGEGTEHDDSLSSGLHSAIKGEDSDEPVDARWAALKQLKDKL
ncbi:MAG: DUF177 domain-containing protein [Bacteroidaceae bacterium]|jgi:uncharacterized metal-binding protein YceD (DUF177 family)|nr:DUF177 domain-containing protein [Bacteroidaceae bacterium]